MSIASEKAKALAADLKAVFKKHKVTANAIWAETESDVVIFSATIKSTEAKTIAGK